MLVKPPERRIVLGRMAHLALGLGAFPLAGCFPTSSGRGATGGGEGGTGETDGGADAAAALEVAEAEVLVAEFLMEDYAIFAYGAAAPALDADARAMAERFRSHHVAHQDHAGETLRRRGYPVPTTPDTYDVELPGDQPGILRLALTLETQAVSGYHAFVAQHAEPALRAVSASILACEVAHVVALLTALGEDAPFEFAFATELPPKVTGFLAASAPYGAPSNP
jgi:hypothetical protein